MVSNISIGLGLAFILSLVDYVSEGALQKSKVLKEGFVSLAAGISTTYIFLHLLPLVYSGVGALSRFIFIFVLLGFVVYHLVEKYIYQHAPRDKVVKDIELEHSVALFFYHFVIGIVLIALIQTGLVAGLFFFLPVSFHVIIDVLPHSHTYKKWHIKLLFAGATFLGAVLAVLIRIPEAVNFALIGLVAGLLLFLEIREVIPKERKGNPALFLIGVLLYGSFILLSWYI